MDCGRGLGDPAEPESSAMWLSATVVAEIQSAEDAWTYIKGTTHSQFSIRDAPQIWKEYVSLT